MSSYQQQAEQEMWEAAARHYNPRVWAFEVWVRETGARCMSTDNRNEAVARADAVRGFVTDRDGDRIYDAVPATDEQIRRSFDAYR